MFLPTRCILHLQPKFAALGAGSEKCLYRIYLLVCQYNREAYREAYRAGALVRDAVNGISIKSAKGPHQL